MRKAIGSGVFALGLAWLVGCGGTVSSKSPGVDAGQDSASGEDSASPVDSGRADTGSETDSGTLDSATHDGGPASDSAVSDSAVSDSGMADVERADSAASDGGAPDAEVPEYHRPSDSQCQTPAPMGTCSIMGGQGFPGGCTSDSQCTDADAGKDGRCSESTGGAIFCSCTYDTCEEDSDCKAGQLCVCHGSPYAGGAGNTCMPGNCRVDSDCGSHGFCSPSRAGGGCGGVQGYYCHTAADTCVNDTDCASSGLPQICGWSASDGKWECQAELLCP